MRWRTWFHSSNAGSDRRSVHSGESVQQRQARCRVERQHSHILRMDHRQMRRKLLEDSHRCRLVVHEDATLAAGCYFAAKDQLRIV